MARILIVDDDDAFRDSLAETFTDLGHETASFESAKRGIADLERRGADLVVLDYRMPEMDGLAALRRIRANERLQGVPVVILTAFAGSDDTIEAMKLGAFDHLTKPVGRRDIETLLARVLRRAAAPDVPAVIPPEDELIGTSTAMREVQKLIGLASTSDSTVLLTGETGSGKERVARAIHANSGRSAAPFIAVNCAAIPAELLESQLFGHVRGAFTGAVSSQRGCFREAAGGTLLLDEIGEMSAAMQAKVLRAVEERAVVPVGAAQAEAVDVRIMSATHQDLGEMVRAGRFREDLYFRLNVLPISLPRLAERGDDIAVLANTFLARCRPARPKRLTERAAAILRRYAWPGNVRELRNVMERLSVLVRSEAIDAADLAFLDAPLPSESGEPATLPAAVRKLEVTLIRRALDEAKGNRAEAARTLGIRRQLLYRKLKEYGLA